MADAKDQIGCRVCRDTGFVRGSYCVEADCEFAKVVPVKGADNLRGRELVDAVRKIVVDGKAG